MAIEKTLILVKPDAFARGLTGEIIARFERKGLTIVAAKHMTVTEDLAKQHYAEHTERPFFGELVELHHLRPDRRARPRGRRRDQGRPPGDRRHEPARGRPRARSAATSRSRSARTWSTGPTRPSPASARRGCSSPSSKHREHPLRPTPIIRPVTGGKFILGSGSPSGARSSSRSASPSPSSSRTSRRRPTGDPVHVAEENARRKARAVAALAATGSTVLGADTLVAVDGDILGKPAGCRPGARVRRAPGRPHPPGGRRDRDRPRRRAHHHRGRDHPGPLPARVPGASSTGTSQRASGRAERAATPSRASAPRSSRASRATTSTSSACPLSRLLDLLPDLLPTT